MSTQVGHARRAAQMFTAILIATALAAAGLGSVAHASTSLTAVQREQVMHFSWTPMGGADYYVIEWAEGAAPTSSPGDNSNEHTFLGSATSGAFDVLFSGNVYFTLFAQLSDGSYEAGPSTGPVAVLTDFTTVTVDESSITASSGAVSWTPVTGATGYAVGVPPADGQTVTPATPGMSQVSGTSTTLTGLAAGTQYVVVVIPLASGGGWGSSGQDYLTTLPAAPSGVSAHQRGYDVHVSWTPPAGGAASGYSIAVGPGGGPTPDLEGPSEYAAPEATSADIYYSGTPGAIKVAVYAMGSTFGSASAPAVTTMTMRDPEVVPDITVTQSTASAVTISWTAVPGAVGYKAALLSPAVVEEGEEPITPSTAGFVAATSPHTFSGLTADSGYYPYVFPIFESNGWGSAGSDHAATRPLPVTGLTAVPNSAGNGNTVLNWAYSGTSQGFTVIARQGSAPTSPDCDSPCRYIGSVGSAARTLTVSESALGGTTAMSKLWHFAVFASSAETGADSLLTTATATPWSVTALRVSHSLSEPYYVPASGSVPASYGLTVRWVAPASSWTKITVTMVAGGTASSSESTGVIYTCTKTSSNACTATSVLKKGLAASKTYATAIWTYDAGGHKARVTRTDLTRIGGLYVGSAWVKGSGLPSSYGGLNHVLDASNNEHVVFARSTGMHYGKRANGSTTWSFVKMTGTLATDSYGTMRVRPDGTLVFVISRYASTASASGVFYQTKTPTGAWSALYRLGATDSSYSFSDIVVDSANTTHVVLSRYTTSPTTSGLFYLRKTTAAGWTAPAKVAGSGPNDYAELVRDHGKTKIAMLISRYTYNPDTQQGATSTLVSIKAASAAAFPTPTVRAGLGPNDYVVGMTMYGARAQLYVGRYLTAHSTSNGVFLQTATVGGTAAAPTLTWKAGGPVRLGGTTYKDDAHEAVLAPNGKVGLVINKESTVASERGLFLAESSTAGVWSAAPVRKSPALTAAYDYPGALAYNSASTAMLAFLRR
jgi:hypothetical protein